MKMRRMLLDPTLAILLALLIALPSALTAQAPEAEADSSAELRSEIPVTYLDLHRARSGIEPLRRELLLKMRQLEKMVGNFGNEVEGADEDFASVQENYRTAIERNFSGEVWDSYQAFLKARESADSLLRKFNQHYKSQAAAILTETAITLADREMGSLAAEPPADQPTLPLRALQQQQLRLKVAQQQMAYGHDNARNHRFAAASDHFRLATLYAIEILRSLEDNAPGSESETMQKYRVHYIDARGGVQRNAGGQGN